MKIRLILISACLLLLVSCSGDDIPTTPSTDPPLATATIGNHGGQVGTDDVLLEVPAGAFDTDVDLAWFLETEEDPYGNGNPVYCIEGLPTTFTDTLRVRLAVPSEKTGDWEIALAEENFSPSVGEIRPVWRHMNTYLQDGWLVVAIPPVQGNQSKIEPEEMRILCSIVPPTWVRLLSPEGKFKIVYDSNSVTASQALNIGILFDGAYAMHIFQGWVYYGNFPRTVELKFTDNEGFFGAWNPCMLGGDYCSLEINSYHINNMAELVSTVGHETLHMFQHFYDPRSDYDKAGSGGPQYWLDEATAVWCEGLFNNSFYVSDARKDYEHKPMHGFPPGPAEGHQDYGYGMSALIHEIVTRTGNQTGIIATYSAIKGGADPVQALLENVTPEIDDWYDDFLKDYLEGGPYGDFFGNTVTLARSNSVTVNPGDDLTEVTFEDAYAARQGRFYRVQFGSGTWPVGTGIGVTATGNLRAPPVSIYRRPYGQPAQLLTSGIGAASADGIAIYIQSGEEILVLVNALEPDQIETTVTVSDMPDISYLANGNFSVEFIAHWQDGATTEEVVSVFLPDGLMTGFTFTSNWHESDSEGSFTGTFEPVALALQSWQITETSYDYETEITVAWNMSGSNIARDSYDEPNVLWYETSTRYAVDEILCFHSIHGALISWEETYMDKFWAYFY